MHYCTFSFMKQCTNALIHKYTNVLMHKYTNALIHLCFNVPVHQSDPVCYDIPHNILLLWFRLKFIYSCQHLIEVKRRVVKIWHTHRKAKRQSTTQPLWTNPVSSKVCHICLTNPSLYYEVLRTIANVDFIMIWDRISCSNSALI